MKKYFFLAILGLFSITSILQAQSATPEVSKNYKPKPQALLPMPDSLTSEKIFPVLGMYTVKDKKDNTYHLHITPDEYQKGIVWISGLPQGKIKAELRGTPATYKIPMQKPLQESVTTEEATVEHTPKKAATATKGQLSGGTLIFDENNTTLYVHLGDTYRDQNPESVFPELSSTATQEEVATGNTITSKKKKKKAVVGTTYIGSKNEATAEASNE